MNTQLKFCLIIFLVLIATSPIASAQPRGSKHPSLTRAQTMEAERRLSLGTGIGATVPNWGDIQKYVLGKIYALGQKASSVTIPHGTFWPDCRTDPSTDHPIKKLDDLNDIVNNVLK